MTALAVTETLRYTCPRCAADVASVGDAYGCEPCKATYPVVLGIPDFRVAPDPWISLEDDREKAMRLAEVSAELSLEETVRAYWGMTPGTPAAQAERFVRYVMDADHRSREWLSLVERDGASDLVSETPWLEIGAGTGDLLVAAAARGYRMIGVDIAMRWLVVARRRAELAGVSSWLVCCNGEHLPFADGSFGRVLSVGTLEHCRSADDTIGEARRVLRKHGVLSARTVNRFTLLREPHVGVWGVGFVPRRWADAYVRMWSRERYLHHRPLSARELRLALRRERFVDARVVPAAPLGADRERLGRLQFAMPAYDRLRRAPVVGSALAWVAPLLEIRGKVS